MRMIDPSTYLICGHMPWSGIAFSFALSLLLSAWAWKVTIARDSDSVSPPMANVTARPEERSGFLTPRPQLAKHPTSLKSPPRTARHPTPPPSLFRTRNAQWRSCHQIFPFITIDLFQIK